jgi:hypothetical protein
VAECAAMQMCRMSRARQAAGTSCIDAMLLKASAHHEISYAVYHYPGELKPHECVMSIQWAWADEHRNKLEVLFTYTPYVRERASKISANKLMCLHPPPPPYRLLLSQILSLHHEAGRAPTRLFDRPRLSERSRLPQVQRGKQALPFTRLRRVRAFCPPLPPSPPRPPPPPNPQTPLTPLPRRISTSCTRSKHCPSSLHRK